MGVSYDAGDGVGLLTIDLPHASRFQVCLPRRVDPGIARDHLIDSVVGERAIDGVKDEQAEKSCYQRHEGRDIDESSP